jgi:hypothetical protein
MPSPSSSRRSSDSEIYFEDWERHRQQDQPRRASAQPRQTDYQPRQASQPRYPDSRRNSSASSPRLLSDAQYRSLQPHLTKYKAADAYLEQAESATLRYEQLISAAKAGCRDGTMTAQTANVYKVQMENACEQYRSAMSQFRSQVAHINASSRINGDRITVLQDGVGPAQSRPFASPTQGRRSSNASISRRSKQPPMASTAGAEQNKKHHRLSHMFHLS